MGLNINGTVTGDYDGNNNDNYCLQNQINTLSSNVATNVVNSKLDVIADSIKETQGNLTAIASADKGDLTAQLTAMNIGFNATNNQMGLQNLNSFNNLNTCMLQGLNTVSRDQANIQSANALQNAITTATNSAGFSDVKSLISTEACKTREMVNYTAGATQQLVNSLRMIELTEALNDAKMKYSNEKQTNEIYELFCDKFGKYHRDDRDIVQKNYINSSPYRPYPYPRPWGPYWGGNGEPSGDPEGHGGHGHGGHD
jgi:hypothetical protein